MSRLRGWCETSISHPTPPVQHSFRLYPIMWSTFSHVFLPFGVVLSLLLVTNISFVERAAAYVSRLKFKTGNVSFSLPFIIFVISVVAFVVESKHLHRRVMGPSVTGLASSALEKTTHNSFKASLFRHQRNWWISAFTMYVWL